jgi:hypothetical protein
VPDLRYRAMVSVLRHLPMRALTWVETRLPRRRQAPVA